MIQSPPPQELVEVIDPTSALKRWDPNVGPETLDLLDHLRLPEPSRERLLQEAVGVLERCLPPASTSGQETGLAVGYVQSGKTMSFTTVTALARDNGYALVILIAGTSVPLLEQSTRRIEGDLRFVSRDDRSWLHVKSNSVSKPSTRVTLRDNFLEWRDESVEPRERRTVLITIMKNHTHLRRLIRALEPLQAELCGLPTLIIDDEADQASLNALVLKNDESTTYRRIKELRAVIPHHTYIQYTATPQAPLLINIIDSLSPRFVEVLTPGPGYVGGRHFFDHSHDLIELIPSDELPSAAPSEPPDSLLRAMRLFFVGVAAGLVQDGGRGNRSMMIHPSQRTSGHGEFYDWVQQIREMWRLQLDPGRANVDRDDVLADFREAHESLARTVADLPSVDLIEKALHRSISKTIVEEINSVRGATPTIAWRDHYPWILVGGQAMDRGFTVEGLTVTYMPRGVGVGNADTVQQRARFFGYKQKYLGYCRVFLEEATYDAYMKYVEHEEDIRRRLIAHRSSGAPLSEWKRRFFLDKALKPTRQSVLDISYSRASGDSEWHYTKVPHELASAIVANNTVVAEFRSRLTLVRDTGSPARTEHQVHLVAGGVPLQVVLEELLTKLQFTYPGDSATFTLLQILLSEHLEKIPDATAIVYVMSAGNPRIRSLNAKGEILNLFQGAAPSKPQGQIAVGDIYPGDRELVSAASVVVQIHYVIIKTGEGSDDATSLKTPVPAIAVYVPAGLTRDILVQDQGVDTQ